MKHTIDNFITKYKKKAELCRYCHSKLYEKNKLYSKIKDFTILFLSLMVSVLLGLHYRGLTGEWVFLAVFIIPIIASLVQGFDSILCNWTDKTSRHKVSMTIWGNWIRDADLTEEEIRQCDKSMEKEKQKNIHEKYLNCMENSATIPSKYFLKYKQKFNNYISKSKEIDKQNE